MALMLVRKVNLKDLTVDQLKLAMVKEFESNNYSRMFYRLCMELKSRATSYEKQAKQIRKFIGSSAY